MADDDELTNTNSNFSEGKNFSSLRTENEFFDENKNIRYPSVSIKRIKTKNREDWEILENNKSVLLLYGDNFSEDEKQFLRSINGIQFVLSIYKKILND